ALADVDRAAHVALEARVEEPGGVLQRRALRERELDDGLVDLAGADDAVVRPDGRARTGRLDPLPLLDDVGVRFVDERAHAGQGLPAPVAELGDALGDEVGW